MAQKWWGVNLCGLKLIIGKAIPVCAICARAEKLLWHQQISHPCNECSHDAHKLIASVPDFEQQTTAVLDQCPTCIQAKQIKVPGDLNLTCVATQPCQGLLIHFCFAGSFLMTPIIGRM